jgi:hypothetical protein
MPFPMAHLNIATKILCSVPDTVNPREFYIGSLAPDSVHFRPNYSGAYKVKSHICIDSWKWGESIENDSWRDNVIRFFKHNHYSVNHSFLCGYCAHVLADMAWNQKVWLPFRFSHAVAADNIYGSGLHQDCYEIDTRLYHQLKEKNKIWELLDNCRCFDITGVVSGAETQKI